MASVRMVDMTSVETMRKSSSMRKVRTLGNSGFGLQQRRGSIPPVSRTAVLLNGMRKDSSLPPSQRSRGRAVASLAAAAQVDLVCKGSWSRAVKTAKGHEKEDRNVPVTAMDMEAASGGGATDPFPPAPEQGVMSEPVMPFRRKGSNPTSFRRPRSPAVAALVEGATAAVAAAAASASGCSSDAVAARDAQPLDELQAQGLSFESIATDIEAMDGGEGGVDAMTSSMSLCGQRLREACAQAQGSSACSVQGRPRTGSQSKRSFSAVRSGSQGRVGFQAVQSAALSSASGSTGTNCQEIARSSSGFRSWSTLWESAMHHTDSAQSPKRQALLLRSVFEGRPPVILFSYTEACGASQRCLSRAFSQDDYAAVGGSRPPKMYFAHGKEVHPYNAVLNTLRQGGLYKTSRQRQLWALYWGGVPKPEVLKTFHPFQKTNHFPNSWQLGRKDYLWQHVRKLQRQFPQMPAVMPQAYVLPGDMRAWEAAREAHPKALWIWKPVNSSCGRGIRVVRSTLDPAFEKKVSQRAGVVQRYIERPLLLDGFKFDLRIYVAVTSYDPLKIYIFSEGLARLATEKYSSSVKSINHRTMHLTNYSVNKCNSSYKVNLDSAASTASTTTPTSGVEDHEMDGAEDSGDEADRFPGAEDGVEDEGCDGLDGASDDNEEGEEAPEAHCQEDADGCSASKWSLQQLRQFLEARGVNYKLMMTRINDLIVKTFVAVEPVMVSAFHAGANFTGSSDTQAWRGNGPNQTCFEIYGMDVLVDADLQPWLLEVNVCPSFSSSSPLDKRIKTQLIADTLTLVGLCPYDNSDVSQALRDDRGCQKLTAKHQSSAKSHTVRSVMTSPLSELGEAEWGQILDAHDENMRCGGFERIFPTKETADRYGHMFQVPRYSNLILARWLKEGGADCFRPEARHLLPSFVPKQVSFETC